jgi:hypothetical protein
MTNKTSMLVFTSRLTLTLLALPEAETLAYVSFDKLVDEFFAEFTVTEWRGFYALNERLWKSKKLKRNAYPMSLLAHAIKTIEKRTKKKISK